MGAINHNHSLEGIYMFDQNGLHNMLPTASEVVKNLDNKIVQAFNGYPLSSKGKDIIWSAIREKKVTLISDHQGTIIGDPGVHYLVVDCEGGIVESFKVQAPVSEILGEKGETDIEIEKLCNLFQSVGVRINRESA